MSLVVLLFWLFLVSATSSDCYCSDCQPSNHCHTRSFSSLQALRMLETELETRMETRDWGCEGWILHDSTGFFGVRGVLRTSKFAGRSPFRAASLLDLRLLKHSFNYHNSILSQTIQPAFTGCNTHQVFPSISKYSTSNSRSKLYEMDRNGTKFIDEDLGHGKYNARPSLLAGKRKALAA